MTDFTKKKVLVLGGSRGIGAAIVRRFVDDGADVVFSYSGSKDAAERLAADTGATAVQADSADRAAQTAAIATQGPVDILVINAGVVAFGDPLELDADVVDRMIDINVRAPYHAATAAARTMPNDGRIIVIGSVNADRVPIAGLAGYGMTKAAMQGLVRGLARDLGGRGITVNSVQPGPTDTDMNPADGPLAELMHSTMAIQRHIRAEEVAGLVAYLAGPEAGMITGSMQTIDGGFAA